MKQPHIVGLGEILWDVFPDGPRFGGAPSNFACSSSELARDKATVSVVSSVGDDDLGRKALKELASHSVNTNGVQISQQPTGQVFVELDDDGVASYRFAENTAWDNLKWSEDLQELAGTCDAVCFGTLGQRNESSRQVIRKFVSETSPDSLRIFDINLRAPYYNNQVILDSLQLANVLKLNNDELPYLAKTCGIAGDEIACLGKFSEMFDLRCIALTRGAHGAVLIRGEEVSDLAGQDVEVADTVGAGDAFTAAMTLGLLRGADVEEINQRAIRTAAFVCSKNGATPKFPDELAFA